MTAPDGHIVPAEPARDEYGLALGVLAGLSGEHAREWRQFLRWALAADLPVLPTTADTVLAYLGDHTGTPATQRGRVTALNTAHQQAKLPAPGAAEAVRRALNPGRSQRLQAARTRADTVIERLPINGWPDALTGRRDAVLLLLATEGLGWTQIAALSQREITVTTGEVRIGAQPLLTLPATGHPRTCPVRVFRRWHQILAHAPAATGHIRLETLLTDPETAGPDGEPGPLAPPAEYRDQPLLCAFDGRGLAVGFIGELDPLPADEIAAITTGVLLGRDENPATGTDLDPDYHERGIAARWRARPVLDELDQLLDRFDDIAAQFDIR
ncbi:hypothetical protein ACIRRA_43340 [Nocardia sp. NPDC101769]|uniref:hypothetical protein n=1 Tax=Nocardia sp. NPDC101769 TaxID=3364333 RepID=UPI00382D5F55